MRGCRRHTPPDPHCPICVQRYSRRTGRAILASNPRRLFAVEFATMLSQEQFRSWRTATWNLVDHKRRECRWWRGVSMQVWLGHDGKLRGVASLDAITAEEFCEAFRRWPVCLSEIEAADLDRAIYAAVAPGVIATPEWGGYQAVKFTLKAQTPVRPSNPLSPAAPIQAARPAAVIDPMPVLL